MKLERNSLISRRTWLGLLAAAPAVAQTPYKLRASVPPAYNSPELLAAGDLLPDDVVPGEVLLGYFGPGDAKHPRGGTMWMGAALAAEDANAAGGFRGAPFRLLPRWSEDAWRSGPSAIVKLAYQEPICALIGGVDGITTHLATQVAAKALFPVIDAISTDESTNHAGVPWVFSWAPGNRTIGQQLQEMLSPAPFLLVAGTDHDSRALADAFLKAGPRHPALRIDTAGLGHPGVPRVADQVVVIAPPECTIACAEAFPAQTRILAGPSASSRLCRSIARRMETPALVCRDEALWKRLDMRFAQPVDAFAQLSFEATTALIGVIREVGPHRAAIREALSRRMPPGGRRESPLPCTMKKETMNDV